MTAANSLCYRGGAHGLLCAYSSRSRQVGRRTPVWVLGFPRRWYTPPDRQKPAPVAVIQPIREGNLIVDYEKGTASWDISMVLTRHDATPYHPCARVRELRRTAGRMHPVERLQLALAKKCDCGRGDSPIEQTSIHNNMQKGPHAHARPTPASGSRNPGNDE